MNNGSRAKYMIAFCYFFISICSSAYSQSNCGPQPAYNPDINESVKGDLEGKAQFFTRLLPSANLKGQIDASKSEIYQKYNNLDRTVIDQFFLWTSCQQIMNDSKLSTSEKIQLWRSIYAELKPKDRSELQDSLPPKREIECEPNKECTVFLDYSGPPLWKAIGKIANDFPSGNWVENSDGSRLFNYDTKFNNHKAQISFHVGNHATDFSHSAVIIHGGYHDFRTNIPENNPSYPRFSKTSGSKKEFTEVCGSTFYAILNKLETEVGSMRDKPKIQDEPIANPLGCQADNSCKQTGSNSKEEYFFKETSDVKLIRERTYVEDNYTIDEGNFFHSEFGFCRVTLAVRDPLKFKPRSISD